MRFDQLPGDVHSVRDSLGGVRWFGLPFALASLLPLLAAVGVIPSSNEDGDAVSPVVLVLFAVPFLSVGLGLLCWRREVTVDLRAGLVRKRTGALCFHRQQQRKLADYDVAAFETRIIRGDKSSTTVYPVMLVTPGGGEFDLLHCRDTRSARRLAEWVAQLAHLAVVDRTSGEPQRREHDELDLSLRDRREQSGEPLEVAPAPAKMRSELRVEGQELVLEVPAFGMQPLVVIGLLFATGPIWLALVFLSMAAGDEPLPGFFVAGVCGIAALPTLGMIGAILFHSLRRFSIHASNRELRVQERGLRSRLTVMPAAEVEELHLGNAPAGIHIAAFLGGGPPIVVTSDAAQVAFGQSLPAKEGRYLADVLFGALSAPV